MYQTLIKPFYQDIKKFVLDTLFPITCLSCGKEEELICNDCQNKLAILDHQICIVCQKPAPLGLTHPKCSSPHTADGLISFFDYHDEKVSKIIINGKYYFLPDVYKILGKIIAQKLKSDYPNLITPPSPPLNLRGGWGELYLIPVPLHKWRLRWRGFNQAEVLCKALGEELNLPVIDALTRKKSTKIQKDIKKREQRKTNVEGAFRLNPHPHLRGPQKSLIFGVPLPSPIKGEEQKIIPSPRGPFGSELMAEEGGVGWGDNIASDDFNIKNKNFILVDDVTTTGSTLLEAAKVLKRNGAAKVWCLTVARD